jgi:mono/diheme cytochrome c family protein
MADDGLSGPGPREPGEKTDQEIFDEQVERGTHKVLPILGGVAIFAALLMSIIALANSGGGTSTTTVITRPASGSAGQGGTGAATAPPLTGEALGKRIFVSGDPGAGVIACGECHTMRAAGTTATIGPNLDKELGPDPASATRESIVDPNKEIIKGYSANVMPKNYGTALSNKELDALVKYIFDNTNTKAKRGSKGP